jgi:exodeoxyribonuclease V gamma subunit
VPIDLIWGADAAPFRLTGLLGGIYPGLGLLRWRAGSLRGPDILGLWLAHLAWCAADGSGEKRSALYTPDEGFVIGATLGPDAARSVLGRYLTWYREGVLRPLPLLPRASYAYALKRELGGGDPVKAARGAWNGSSFVGVPGDKDDPYVRLVMRGVAGDPIEREDFATLAGASYGEVLHCGEAT